MTTEATEASALQAEQRLRGSRGGAPPSSIQKVAVGGDANGTATH